MSEREPRTLYEWTGRTGLLYRAVEYPAIAGEDEPLRDLEVLCILDPDHPRWNRAAHSGRGAAALELQRLAGERDAAGAQGLRLASSLAERAAGTFPRDPEAARAFREFAAHLLAAAVLAEQGASDG